PGRGQQQPQGSGRVNQPRGEEGPKHTFQPGNAPSEQGEKDQRSAEVVARGQQGLGGAGNRGSGSSRAQSDRSEQEAQSGEPAGDHTRHGRQGTPGNRPG